MTNNNEKLDALRKRQKELLARIAQVEAADNAQRRREDTREKVLIGAAIIADIKLHPETRSEVTPVIRRAITADRDVQFLKTKGWL